MNIQGKVYLRDSSAYFNAVLHVLGETYVISLPEGQQSLRGNLCDLAYSDRIGNIERKILLENGAVFTTLDNESVDGLARSFKKTSSLIHLLESSLGWVVIGLCVTMFTVVAFFKWGVPWTSEKIAHALPQKTNEIIAGQTLSLLDKYLFSESLLPKKEQDALTQHFINTVVPLGKAPNDEAIYRLHFRMWEVDGHSIPNAFALPSGDIVVTDAFINLAQSQEEIDSVLFHEIGHIVHRHSLISLIESAFISAVVILVVGDAGTLADIGVGAGTLLVSSHYSRHHESQADIYAFNQMLNADRDPIAFARIMDRMEKYALEGKQKAVENDTGVSDEPVTQADTSPVLDYFSSHPQTQARIKMAERYSECFNQGLRVCDIDE